MGRMTERLLYSIANMTMRQHFNRYPSKDTSVSCPILGVLSTLVGKKCGAQVLALLILQSYKTFVDIFHEPFSITHKPSMSDQRSLL